LRLTPIKKPAQKHLLQPDPLTGAPVPMNGNVRTKVTRDDLKKAAPVTPVPAPANAGNDNRTATTPVTTEEEEKDDQPLVLDQNDLPDNNPTERVNGKPVMGRVFSSLPNNYKVADDQRQEIFCNPGQCFLPGDQG
jgi:hypothetical protein